MSLFKRHWLAPMGICTEVFMILFKRHWLAPMGICTNSSFPPSTFQTFLGQSLRGGEQR